MPINSYPLLRAVLIWGERARTFCVSEEDQEIIAFLCFTGKPVAKTKPEQRAPPWQCLVDKREDPS